MKFPRSLTNSGRIKNSIHGVQAVIIFLAWALTIAVFAQGKGIDGRSAWYWALCWFSVPGLIYLVGVPMWPRTRRFGNIYAFAIIDLLYAILWSSAWICVASYVAQGKSIGISGDNDKTGDNSKNQVSANSGSGDGGSNNRRRDTEDDHHKGGCDAWAYGSATACNISTATVILGVVISLLFVLTAWISFRNVKHFRQTGTLPDTVPDPTFAAQSQAAFSSNPAQDFDEEDDFRSGRSGLGPTAHDDGDEDYALLQQSEIEEMGGMQGRTAMHGTYDPTAPNSGAVLHDFNMGYGGAHGQHFAPSTELGSSVSEYR